MSQTSQNGWAADADPVAIKIKQFSVAGTTIKLRAQEIAGIILSAFAAEFHKLVEPIDKGTLDDWGYSYRDIRGTTGNLSNHSSGTAIDLNASKHQLGKSGTFTPEQVATIHTLIKKYHLRWGGDYKDRKDEMHFEITESLAHVASLVKELGLK